MNGSLLPFSDERAARKDTRAQKNRILTLRARRQTLNSRIEASTRPSVFFASESRGHVTVTCKCSHDTSEGRILKSARVPFACALHKFQRAIDPPSFPTVVDDTKFDFDRVARAANSLGPAQ